MTLSYRPYTDDDLSLIQEHVMMWRSLAPSNTSPHAGDIPHRLYNGNRGRFNLSEINRIYSDGDNPVAFLLAYPRQGFMDVIMHSEYVAKHDLLLPVIEDGYQILSAFASQQDEEPRPISIDCYTDDVLRQKLLARANFKPQEIVFVVTRRALHDTADVSLPDGYSIRQATMQDTEQLAQVHSASFGSKWTTETYRDEVMLKPGYKPEEEFIVVAPDSTFAAFTKIWFDTVNKVGLFEPVGTHNAHRRKGLARSLMLTVMKHMRESGMLEAEVCYEPDNLASKTLYTALGFEPRHHIQDWTKQVTKDLAS